MPKRAAKAGNSAGANRARSRAPNKASTTVFPVTWQCAGSTPSRRRFARAPSVGQKCQRVNVEVTRRFISSGKGVRREPVRRPASTCPTGIPE